MTFTHRLNNITKKLKTIYLSQVNKLAKLLQQQSINEVVQLTLQSNSLEDDKLIQQVEQSLPTLKHTVEALEYTYHLKKILKNSNTTND